MVKKVQKSSTCLNCSQELSDENYCPNCGQLNDSRRPNLITFINESLSNFFAFDSKLFITLVILFRYPGRLAKDYSAGKRVKYMPPIRIYFISSLLFLFVSNIDSVTLVSNEPAPEDQKLVGVIDTTLTNHPETDSNDVSLNFSFKDSPAGNHFQQMFNLSKSRPNLNSTQALDSLKIEHTSFNLWSYKQVDKYYSMDKDEFERYLSTKTFWILFLFLPLFALWLKLIYVRRDFYYLENLFFTFYTQSAFFILLTIESTLAFWIDSSIVSIITFSGFAIYLFIALKSFYNQGTGKTLVKFFLLNLGFFIFALFFLAMTMLISFIFY